MSLPRPGSVTGPDSPPMEAGRAISRPLSRAAPGFAERMGLTGPPSPVSRAGPTGLPNRAAVSPWMPVGGPAPAAPAGRTSSAAPAVHPGRGNPCGGSPPDVRLTGRGAILALLVLSFAGFSSRTGWAGDCWPM